MTTPIKTEDKDQLHSEVSIKEEQKEYGDAESQENEMMQVEELIVKEEDELCRGEEIFYGGILNNIKEEPIEQKECVMDVKENFECIIKKAESYILDKMDEFHNDEECRENDKMFIKYENSLHSELVIKEEKLGKVEELISKDEIISPDNTINENKEDYDSVNSSTHMEILNNTKGIKIKPCISFMSGTNIKSEPTKATSISNGSEIDNLDENSKIDRTSDTDEEYIPNKKDFSKNEKKSHRSNANRLSTNTMPTDTEHNGDKYCGKIDETNDLDEQYILDNSAFDKNEKKQGLNNQDNNNKGFVKHEKNADLNNHANNNKGFVKHKKISDLNNNNGGLVKKEKIADNDNPRLVKSTYKCNKCDKTFTLKGNWKRHAVVHTVDKPFKCDKCKKTFRRNQYLKEHSLIHSGEKPYNCDQCDKTFTRKTHLTQHTATHTGDKPFKCNECEKSFSRKGNLEYHLMAHTEEREKNKTQVYAEEKGFNCDKCEKSFIWSCQLRNHAVVHTGEKPFKCGQCGKRFAWKTGLKLHALQHTGVKRFKCDRCEKSFAQSGHLKIHKRIHDGI